MKALIYTRQSKHKDESATHETQEKACRSYAKSKGWDVVSVVNERGRSGRSIHKRQEFQDAVQAVEDGQAEVLLVWRWSRFARNTTDGLITIRSIRDAGGKVASALETVDESAAGKFSLTMLLAIAEMESDVKSETWKETHSRRLGAGDTPNGRRYFGYVKGRDGYTVNEAEAALLKEAFNKYISGVGSNTIAAWLNEQGSRTARGGLWNVTSLLRMMDNPFHTGHFNWKGETVKGNQPVIIDEATWAAYQKKRKANYNAAPAAKGSKNWLSGLIFCSKCNGKMSVHTANRGQKKYRCTTRLKSGKTGCTGLRIRAVDVEVALMFWLQGHFEEWVSALPSDDEARAKAQAEVDKAQIDRDSAQSALTELLLQGKTYGLPESAMADAMEVRKTELEAAQKALEDTQAALGAYVPATTLDERFQQGMELMKMPEDPDAEIPQETRQLHRSVVEQIVERIDIMPADYADYERGRVVIVPRP